MINAYGPTETTVCASMTAPLSGSEPVPIGSPGRRGGVVRPRSVVAAGGPSGWSASLYVAGAGVGVGYVGRSGG